MNDYRATHKDPLTREIRADGWAPRQMYLCGCNPKRLCVGHAEIRGVEHYQPELAR